MDVRLIEARTHGRVVVRSADARRLLIGFHGYAQNAEEHLADLEPIPGVESWTIAAVQGLHRFYRSRSELVVASWMTRQDRETAIADNIDYVRRVVDSFGEQDRLVFAGFSQGAAMAYRAAAAIRCAAVLILGGDLPPDVDASKLPHVLIGHGSRDEWFTSAKLDADRVRIPSAEVIELDAGHEWTDAFRAKAGEFLRAASSQA
ncbi:MAG TPA: phospholipase [Thermoanaerobaculia bacterium]|nr:phospholipase [Thermoanaerobaculia bacterium]